MALFLLSVMLTLCAASPQDLSGKMFTFPEPSDSAHVRLTTSRQVLSAVTVCLRFFTDLRRDYSLFSLANLASDNELLIFNSDSGNTYNYYIKNKVEVFIEQHYKLNTWHSICTTWDSESGLGQLWLDGKPSSRKYISSGSNISGPIIIVLGQEQDSHGGGFDEKQCFVGMMSDVNMWDYNLSPCEIQNYMHHLNFAPGNVLNWRALEFQTTGRLLIEDKQEIKTCN
ncbi:C-reactive protein-like [Etheostoma cragini]|uniref:C-reactive protein-like n=1 Tax=Etheostoma cragini TaxID=417921 RepID=UPI00155EECA6|nr:C-reactive protein-like [Etheostoma cragini]